MKLVPTRYGGTLPIYDSREEETAAIRCYLRGEFGELTSDEIAFMNACARDPLDCRGAAERADLTPDDREPPAPIRNPYNL